MLRAVEWPTPSPPASSPETIASGRQRLSVPSGASSRLDVLIDAPMHALQRESGFTTDRADNTVLTILDPVAIFDDHLFRFGDPPHTYSVKAVDGVIQDEDTGTRYASEVVCIR